MGWDNGTLKALVSADQSVATMSPLTRTYGRPGTLVNLVSGLIEDPPANQALNVPGNAAAFAILLHSASAPSIPPKSPSNVRLDMKTNRKKPRAKRRRSSICACRFATPSSEHSHWVATEFHLAIWSVVHPRPPSVSAPEGPVSPLSPFSPAVPVSQTQTEFAASHLANGLVTSQTSLNRDDGPLDDGGLWAEAGDAFSKIMPRASSATAATAASDSFVRIRDKLSSLYRPRCAVGSALPGAFVAAPHSIVNDGSGSAY